VIVAVGAVVVNAHLMPTSTTVKHPGRIVAALLLALCVGATPVQSAGGCGEATAIAAVGQAALDGDTMRTDDGREWRLAGVLAPKRGDGARTSAGDDDPARRVQRPRGSPADAARIALETMILRQTLWLIAMGDSQDRHGRRVASVLDASCQSIAQRLLASGHVRVYPTVATRSLAAALYRTEAAARAELRGLWTDPRYRLLAPGETAGKVDSYVVVEGPVVAVSVLRSATMVTFGADRSRDFAVAIEPRVRKLLLPAGLDPAGWAGRTLRVRGWLRQKGGAPVIDLVVPEQVEVVGS
jgi:endonuclease YncB( thermonuclease family)